MKSEKEYLSDGMIEFNKGNYLEALNYAKQVIKMNSKCEDGFLLAGQVALALSDANMAAQFFSDLVRVAPKGDYFYLLGQAQAMNDDGMNAISNFEKALQNGCSTENKGKIYKIMSMLNVEMGSFEDGLKNIENASIFIGLDLELLKSRYLCYAGLEDYKKAIASCNQMKLISPSSYEAYSMIFEILMGLELYDEAGKELERARRSIKPLPQTYYNDKAKYILVAKTKNDSNNLTNEILNDVLNVYAESLDNMYMAQPDYDTIFSIILRGAQTYLQLNDGKNTLRLTLLLWDIPSAYKKRESLLEVKLKTEEELDEVYYSEFFDKLGSLTSDEVSEEFEKVEDRLTPLTGIPDKQSDQNSEDNIIDSYVLSDNQKEIIWGLEISAYDLLKEYNNELKSAERLQGSDNINSNYFGKYSVLRCKKFLNHENWKKNYENAIGYWKNQRLENPDDILALPYEIRCLIDLESFDAAESMIEKLPAQTKDSFKKILKQEKSESQ